MEAEEAKERRMIEREAKRVECEQQKEEKRVQHEHNIMKAERQAQFSAKGRGQQRQIQGRKRPEVTSGLMRGEKGRGRGNSRSEAELEEECFSEQSDLEDVSLGSTADTGP